VTAETTSYPLDIFVECSSTLSGTLSPFIINPCSEVDMVGP